MIELVAGILLVTGAVYFVLRPILHSGPATEEAPGDTRGNEGEDPDDDLSPRAVALRALKEIEFDRATGKLSDQDYDELKAKYTAEALAALRSEPREPGAGSREPVLPPALRSPLPARSCPEHGPRRESGSQFCSECGRRLGTAPGYCARCGTSLEQEAHYCHACGARVAA
ncbi:MAG TPA: zinc ribbon domain-containing protein [Gemmatimonadales bacterium]|nr:zinc ribbon domain-containing protein [Gemmatimonadales bacterium]